MIRDILLSKFGWSQRASVAFETKGRVVKKVCMKQSIPEVQFLVCTFAISQIEVDKVCYLTSMRIINDDYKLIVLVQVFEKVFPADADCKMLKKYFYFFFIFEIYVLLYNI